MLVFYIIKRSSVQFIAGRYKSKLLKGKQNKSDEIILLDKIKLIIDYKSILNIIGTEIDFERSDLHEKFTFKNPNVKELCGYFLDDFFSCGESFKV